MRKPWHGNEITIHIECYMGADDPWTPVQWFIHSPGMHDTNPTTLQEMRQDREIRAEFYSGQGYIVVYKTTKFDSEGKQIQ